MPLSPEISSAADSISVITDSILADVIARSYRMAAIVEGRSLILGCISSIHLLYISRYYSGL